MNYLESLILGVIQGLTEFLPISSSGHLEIFKVIFGSDLSNSESLLFTIILHFATALSTIYYFKNDLLKIFKGIINKKSEDVKFSKYILISMIPAVLAGLFLEETIDVFFSGNLVLIGIMLFLTGIFLLLTDFIKKGELQLNTKNSLFIGIAQAIAILPGISRSGATIASAVLLRINKENATKFSFLMVVPVIFGSILKSILDQKINFENFDFLIVLTGFGSAFFTGLLACKWMIYLVKKSKLYYFAIYCFVVGSLVLLITNDLQ